MPWTCADYATSNRNNPLPGWLYNQCLYLYFCHTSGATILNEWVSRGWIVRRTYRQKFIYRNIQWNTFEIKCCFQKYWQSLEINFFVDLSQSKNRVSSYYTVVKEFRMKKFRKHVMKRYFFFKEDTNDFRRFWWI